MQRADIERLRKWLGLTQEAFAQRVGVSVRTVAGWEAGTRKPSPLARERITALYQLKLVEEEEQHAITQK